ncbi:MAG: chitobiase/beta-hexosaminidase C-terminal domain-containing protein [Saprospirales bacterium]|nr:chitobiase/beta-hexosaminidase C-terminal domain-containing protein [Saprospirales bacterium]
MALNCASRDALIYYTLDGSEPAPATALKFEKPFAIDKTTTLKAVAIHPESGPSKVIAAEFVKRSRKVGIALANPYGRQYTAGGDQGLVDGLEGGPDFRTGEWQGYEGVDLDATLDLGESIPLKEVAVRFLQDENAWIFYPLRVEFAISEDGKNWKDLGPWRRKPLP